MGINYKPKSNKCSYSKLNTYDSCPFKYYLMYETGHYVYQDSLAADFGTLVHWILEHIGLDLKEGRKPDYDKLKQDFVEINIPKKNKFDTEGGIYGINILKKKYPREFFEPNKDGKSFVHKSKEFLDYGIYRLEKRLSETPNLKVWACEQFFDVSLLNRRFSGFIDRILYDTTTGDYYVEDIKTKDHPFSEDELKTPLQFVIYVKALCEALEIDPKKVHCAYDMPVCDLVLPAGTKGYLARGMTKMAKMFEAIDNQDFHPEPTPLCWWCPFNHGNPNIPEEGRHLCPYYSLWRPDHKTFEVANLWEGMDRHSVIVKRLDKSEIDTIIEFDF